VKCVILSSDILNLQLMSLFVDPVDIKQN